MGRRIVQEAIDRVVQDWQHRAIGDHHWSMKM
jgi:hypothetical protein